MSECSIAARVTESGRLRELRPKGSLASPTSVTLKGTSLDTLSSGIVIGFNFMNIYFFLCALQDMINVINLRTENSVNN